MKTKELATDELLKLATPRPWWREDAGFIAGHGGCMIADFDCLSDEPGLDIDEREANKALTNRAVNSFESMRESLRLIRNQSVGPDWTHEQAFNFMREEAKKALALAEGKAVQSSPAENWTIYRSDGRQITTGFATAQEAIKAAHDLKNDRHPFTYTVKNEVQS